MLWMTCAQVASKAPLCCACHDLSNFCQAAFGRQSRISKPRYSGHSILETVRA